MSIEKGELCLIGLIQNSDKKIILNQKPQNKNGYPHCTMSGPLPYAGA
ncbi:hypothetical protein [Gibbsiella quercinecans]